MWLWAARFFKSRSLATAACRAGKIRVNDVVAKASTSIKAGDEITWRDVRGDFPRDRRVHVVELLPRRVGAPEAVKAYIDFSAPILTKLERGSVPMRDRGAGRPEKKDRRAIDKLRGFKK
jgi:ribosome-associated heat shock protein Hsp15